MFSRKHDFTYVPASSLYMTTLISVYRHKVHKTFSLPTVFVNFQAAFLQ